MKIKTSELSGIALDWAVAKCEGFNYGYDSTEGPIYHDEEGWLYAHEYKPSSDWSQGGPIIDRGLIDCEVYLTGGVHWISTDIDGISSQRGNTPLIAAMRCYVASKLGDEVNAPDELIKD